MHIKKMLLLMSTAVAIVVQSVSVYAEVPYRSYNYDYWEYQRTAPVPYAPVESISGEEVGVDQFSLPTDLVIDESGKIYILDAGNGKIVVLDESHQLLKEITGFINNGEEDHFKNPSGLFISKSGSLYIADTDNNRVVELTKEGELVRIFKAPQDATLGEDFVFLPTKVTVDDANRIYVVAKNVFEGLISFDQDGNFLGYFGTIKVEANIVDIFWRKIATKAQRAKMQLFIPTEFTNIDIDDEGFIYATNIDYTNEETIKKINPSGKNVLTNYTNRKIQGDLSYRMTGPYSGRSTFVDVKYRGKGIYSALDSNKGKIFTYDSEGNMLYVFGGMGTTLGMFKKPVAVECYNEKIYVLDESRNEIVVFEPTQYGHCINEAVGLRFDGDETEAVAYWKEVLKLDAQYELAYSGIGKSLLASGDNKEAMHYLKNGNDKRYYSVAYKRYRTEVLKANLKYIFTGTSVIIIVYFGIKVGKKIKRKGSGINA